MKIFLRTLTVLAALTSFISTAADLTNAIEIITKANLASYYTADDGSVSAHDYC